jgi:hypothetical protein
VEPFNKYFYIVTELKDTKRNQQDMVRAYGLDKYGGSPEQATARASELINLWNKYEPLIGTDPEEYGFPRNIRGLNPKDIFAWSRASKSTGDDELEALQNLEAMLANLKKVQAQREQTKQEQDDYETVYKSDMVTVYIPRSVGASCKLGAGTKWCTAATKSQNMFKHYTQDQGVTLYYIFTKHDGKFALALYPDGGTIEVFDEEDNVMNREDLDKILRDHGMEGGIKTFAKVPEPEERLLELCKRYVGEIDKYKYDHDIRHGENNRNYNEGQIALYDDIINQSLQLSISKPDVYQKLRQETGMPDKAVLAWKGWSRYINDIGSPDDGADTVSQGAIMFYTEKHMNPAGTMPEANKQFQSMFIETLLEYHDMLLRLGSRGEPPGAWYDGDVNQKKKYEQWRETAGTLEIYAGEGKQDQLVWYIKNHMNGEWSELEDTVMEIILDLPSTSINQYQIASLFRVIMRLKGGRWHEFENAMKQFVEEESERGWTDESANILRWSQMYNSLAAGVIGSPELIKYLPTYQDVIGNKS